MNEIIRCKYCGEELVIKSTITDREWSKQKSWYLSHPTNRRCAAQHPPRFYPSEDDLLQSVDYSTMVKIT